MHALVHVRIPCQMIKMTSHHRTSERLGARPGPDRPARHHRCRSSTVHVVLYQHPRPVLHRAPLHTVKLHRSGTAAIRITTSPPPRRPLVAVAAQYVASYVRHQTPHTHTHTRARARAHTRTHTHTHAHTHTHTHVPRVFHAAGTTSLVVTVYRMYHSTAENGSMTMFKGKGRSKPAFSWNQKPATATE